MRFSTNEPKRPQNVLKQGWVVWGGVGGGGTDGWLGGGAGRTSWVGCASVSENRRLGRVWIQFILENMRFTPCDGSFLEARFEKTKSSNGIRAPPPYTRNFAIPRERRRAGKILGILPQKVALSLNLGVQKWTSRRACVVGKLLGRFWGGFCDVMPPHTIL